MATFNATRVSLDSFELAEGIIFDARADRLRWVDIGRGALYSAELGAGRIVDVEHTVLGETVGAVALANDGGLLVAAARGLACVSPESVVSFGPDLLDGRRQTRLNDGAVDPQGRFIVGSVSVGQASGNEVLLRVSADGTVETLRGGIQLSNGIAFSPDGALIYHVDTLARTVSCHSYGPGPFDHEERWLPVLRDFQDLPDGLTVDAEGGLWVAMWGGASVLHYDHSGVLRDTVVIGAAQVTCPAFVGSSLDVLAATTAHDGLENWEDGAGSIFLADVGVHGLPEHLWLGSTSSPYWVST